MDAINLTVWLALVAGFLSFISPCTLPLYPSFLSYITGVSTFELSGKKGIFQHQAMLHTVFFLFGFSIIFFALGLSASLLGDFFSNYQDLIRQLGAILIIVMGLFMIGIFQPHLLMKEKRFELKSRPSGYLGSVLVGITYAAGWTPCIGPIFTAILALGATNPEQSLIYVFAYTLGFGIPFFMMAFFIGRMKWINRYTQLMMKIGGSMMVLMGLLLFTDKMTEITIWLISLYGGFTGF